MSKKPTILCVDDQAANLRVRTMLLEQFGCDTIAALDHGSALRAVRDNPVDLMVIDYHLAHGESGETVARDVRAMRPQLPLIMLTGDTHLPPSAEGTVDAVLIKGTSNPGALLDWIQKLLPASELKPRRPRLVSEPRKPHEENESDEIS